MCECVCAVRWCSGGGLRMWEGVDRVNGGILQRWVIMNMWEVDCILGGGRKGRWGRWWRGGEGGGGVGSRC